MEVHGGEVPFVFRADPPKSERKRHVRKYAAGELRPDKSFYFRGPDGKLNLRAQNLQVFLQLGDGVDDETWLYHLRQGDYSRWLREAIRDEALADEVVEVEALDPGCGAEPDADPGPGRGPLYGSGLIGERTGPARPLLSIGPRRFPVSQPDGGFGSRLRCLWRGDTTRCAIRSAGSVAWTAGASAGDLCADGVRGP